MTSFPGPEPIPSDPPAVGPSDPLDGQIEHLAELDLERHRRLGMAEAIWGQHKSAEQIAAILGRLAALDRPALVTRVGEAKAAEVQALVPGSRHHPGSRCLTLGPLGEPRGPALVSILTGGTSDLAVAQEAALALTCAGVASELVVDVGVAGLHRLLGRLVQLRRSRVLIACAGMEGALPTVLAGLVPQPVIAVPVSVGYGVSEGGRAALHGMLASCAPGLMVVNIDNGYGAAMAALRILRSGS